MIPSLIGLAHAAGEIVPGIPGPLNPSSSGGILAFIQNAYLFALGIAGLLAVASIAWGGIQYTVSRGNPSQLSDAWDRIVQAFVGVLLLVGAGTILSVVNPGLTSLELPDLQNVERSAYDPANPNISGGQINDASDNTDKGDITVVTPTTPPAGTQVLMVGDSHCTGGLRYTFASVARSRDFQFTYDCKPGRKTAEQLARMDSAIASLSNPASSTVYVVLGTNDGGRCTTDSGCESHLGPTIDAMKGKLQRAGIKRAVWITPPQLLGYDGLCANYKHPGNTNEVMTRIARVIQSHFGPYSTMSSMGLALTFQGCPTNRQPNDGPGQYDIHPDTKGYSRWATWALGGSVR